MKFLDMKNFCVATINTDQVFKGEAATRGIHRQRSFILGAVKIRDIGCPRQQHKKEIIFNCKTD
jgi:hypothetical protein